MLLPSLLVVALMPTAPQPTSDRCIAFLSRNLAKGNENYHTYFQFSDLNLKIRPGDILAYEVFLDPRNPEPKGGIDVEFVGGGSPLRDLHPKDQHGVDAHGDGMLEAATGAWLERRIPLELATGRTSLAWNLVFEGDKFGTYLQFVDNVRILHNDGSTTNVYATGALPRKLLIGATGYSNKPYCLTVDRDRVTSAADLAAFALELEATGERLAKIDEAKEAVRIAKAFVARNPDAHLQDHVNEAAQLLDAVASKSNPSPQEIEAVLHAAQRALAHTHPVMERYTGHLVGHAHIDLQWLWEWQEGIVATRDTFAQAVRFMDEYKGFTFSQSSSCLYQTIEENYPELFQLVKKKIQSGQWEIVGGRVCEGDTNLISAESSARHFLYGQLYFRERFGKIATVGWEPDTFGHNAQMPQILKLGGCNSYYFCRAGKGKPLFWWEGLDGTRILTFEEPATGSWYNSDLSYKQFEEMLKFEQDVGSRDSLMVYGVGNHGGGPTREYIETALAWMKNPAKPKVKFSTAGEFFRKLRTFDLRSIPVVEDELNPVFDGCYTSHIEIKALNRVAESETSSAEAVATIASFAGFAYPKKSFRRNWEDITINHHHDTLPGSGIHPPYENTQLMLQRVIADARDISNRALQTLSLRVTPKTGGISVLVANPTGWDRDGWVSLYLVQSGWDGSSRLDPERCAAYAPDGAAYPVEVTHRPSRLGRFYAKGIPAFGYKVFQIKNASNSIDKVSLENSETKSVLENGFLRVEFDLEKGTIQKITDKATGKSIQGSMGLLENHFESPGGMSAWVIGGIKEIRPWLPMRHTIFSLGSTRMIRFEYHIDSVNSEVPTGIEQTFSLDRFSQAVQVSLECDWQHIGSRSTPNPLLRVAMHTDLVGPTAHYEIPFGSLGRKSDGREYPALAWGALRSKDIGIALLNTSHHGYSASEGTLRMSLIRSSFDPDPVPNPGLHSWRYAIAPLFSNQSNAALSRSAAELAQPLFKVTVPFDARGQLPSEWRMIDSPPEEIIPTSLKKAELGEDLILRFHNAGEREIDWRMQTGVTLQKAEWVNFLEDRLEVAGVDENTIDVRIGSFVIKTAKMSTKKASSLRSVGGMR